MANRWPIVRVFYGPFELEATHALPHAIHPEGKTPHSHKWRIWAMCESEIQPNDGWTWDEDEIKTKVGPTIRQLQWSNLNEQMKIPPTTEALALYLLARLPGWVEGIRIERDTGGIVETTRKMNGRNSFASLVLPDWCNPDDSGPV